ncbi:MAG: menaquinone biosynthesis protein [Candidatus Obscuribacterales bacterium]|nr:menaquinone biosynthesis protein [Candidatus Obscuribacterales bacterium]
MITAIIQAMLKQRQSVKVGQISFLNVLPVTLPLQRAYIKLDAELSFGTPNQLNKLFESGNLKLGAMSAFYFLQKGNFDLFPELSISAKGSVASVLLFSKLPCSELGGKTITVPESSATSINLLHVLLKEEFGVTSRFKQQTTAELSNPEVDAALLIGDDALSKRADLEKDYLCFDLGQWWHRLYALPMVFGVWAADKVWKNQNQEEFSEIAGSFKAALELGLGKYFPEVIAEAKKLSNLPSDLLKKYYLENLNFELSDSHRQGLSHYAALCRKHGLI